MQLREHAKALGILDRVELTQWLPRPEAERLMSEADVGLVPHAKSEHTDSTVPHKLFQYMWRRLPVIVSNCRPLQRIVQETGCGLIYKSGDPQSLADCLGEMYAREDRMTTMGAAGHSAVRDKYNWDVAGQALLSVYDQLL
jgi:glycosyltransferase involved in cell wall biosynthesis